MIMCNYFRHSQQQGEEGESKEWQRSKEDELVIRIVVALLLITMDINIIMTLVIRSVEVFENVKGVFSR